MTPKIKSEEERLRSGAGTITCQCGNRICLNGVNDYWLSIIKEREKAIVEEVEKLKIFEDQSPNYIKDVILSILKQTK